MSNRIISSALFFLTLLGLFQGCSGSSKPGTNNTTQATASLLCGASGSLLSTSDPLSSTVQLSNLAIQILNGGTGPFVITVPGYSPITISSTSYTFPSSVNVTTDSSGNINSQVSVTDNSTGSSTTCTISSNRLNSGTANVATISASPASTVSVGNSITLTATSYGGSTGSIFNFVPLSQQSGVSIYSSSNNSAIVNSSVAGSVIVNVTEVQNGFTVSSGQITLNFTGSSNNIGNGNLICQLTHSSGSFSVGSQIVFTISTNTGEPILVTQWNPGEAWSSAPIFPLSPPLSVSYSYNGVKSVHIMAQSAYRPGVYCNGGAVLTDSVTVY